MQALADTWERLTIGKRIALIGSVVATLVVFFFLARSATSPSMKLLFGGLEDQVAGGIVTQLEQLGEPYEVRGKSIYVPANKRDELRFRLASEGLVKDGVVGYELLDGMSGFGTTREMFRTAVKRATEGELRRTIEAMPDVRIARIMVVFSERKPFQRVDEKATASVSVRSLGGKLSQKSASAIRYLVALAVPGLDPQQVAVVDMEHGVVLKPGDENVSEAGDDREKRLEAGYRKKIEALLIEHVGEGAFRAEVTVQTTRETKKVSERIIDPNSQAPTTSSSSETTEKSTSPSGAVTVASNLPDGDAAAQNNQGSSDKSTTTEKIAYTYSTTTRDQIQEPGAIQKLSVGVVIDEVRSVDANGAVTRTPRAEADLEALEKLIKSAIGFDEARGDTFSIYSLPFVDPNVPEDLGEESGSSFFDEHGGMIIQLGILAVVALVLALFVVRPILMSEPRFEDQYPLIEGTLAPSGSEPLAEGQQAIRIGPDGQPVPLSADVDLGAAAGEGAAGASAEGGAAAQADSSDLDAAGKQGVSKSQSAQLRDVVRDKLDDSVALLRSWLLAKAADDLGGDK